MNQIDIYRKMTGEQRLMHAIKLSALIREIAMTSIKNDFPKLSQKQLIEKYLERLSITKYGRARNSSRTNPAV